MRLTELRAGYRLRMDEIEREQKREAEQQPVREAGGGEAEGFEESEKLLRDRAEHRDPAGNPKYDAPEPEEGSDPSVYGEADHVEASEDAAPQQGEPE